MPVKVYDGTNWVTVAGDGAQGATGASGTAPLTTKGDLLGFDTAANRVAVGTNGQTLTADSTAATGLAWSNTGMTLISTTALSGTSTTVSSIPATYKHLFIVVRGVYQNSANNGMRMTINGDSGSNYYWSVYRNANGSATFSGSTSATYVDNVLPSNPASNTNVLLLGQAVINLYRYTDSSFVTGDLRSISGNDASPTFTYTTAGNFTYKNTAAVTSFALNTGGAATFTGGTIYLYGVN